MAAMAGLGGGIFGAIPLSGWAPVGGLCWISGLDGLGVGPGSERDEDGGYFVHRLPIVSVDFHLRID